MVLVAQSKVHLLLTVSMTSVGHLLQNCTPTWWTKNSKDLVTELATVMIEDGDIFNSHDVVSLFTNTPIQETLSIIKNRLIADTKLKQRTLLEVEDIMELTEFIATTTYFSFRGTLYKQKFGTAMGSPVSPLLANLFMEWLEQEAMATAPIECRPKLWKRYVDDILEIVKKNEVENLTNHLNQIDKSNSIKFTHEEEKEGTIPFLDTLIVRKPDKSVKLLVYRKATHTDQYLSFQSHHPLQQKLGVIRTLMDRCHSIVTEPEDKEKEMSHIKTALKVCGYPEWSFVKVEQQQKQKQELGKNKKQPEKTEEKKVGIVILPYVRGCTEQLQRIFHKYNIFTAVKPHRTLRSMLVHPMDKIDKENKCNVVYKVKCKNCEKCYIGETGRQLKTRIGEHKEDVKSVPSQAMTRSQRKDSTSVRHKSAISDHIHQNNHVIEWENISIVDREDNRQCRQIRESIAIKSHHDAVMNRDEGSYDLGQVWDCVLTSIKLEEGGH